MGGSSRYVWKKTEQERLRLHPSLVLLLNDKGTHSGELGKKWENQKIRIVVEYARVQT